MLENQNNRRQERGKVGSVIVLQMQNLQDDGDTASCMSATYELNLQTAAIIKSLK